MSIIEKCANEIIEQRTKILSDFIKAYVASRDDFPAKEVIRRLKLVETIISPTKRTYHCELRRCKLIKLNP